MLKRWILAGALLLPGLLATPALGSDDPLYDYVSAHAARSHVREYTALIRSAANRRPSRATIAGRRASGSIAGSILSVVRAIGVIVAGPSTAGMLR